MTPKSTLIVVNGGEEKGENVDLKEVIKDFLDKSLLLLFIHMIIFNDLLLLPDTEERPKLGLTNKYLVKKIGIF